MVCNVKLEPANLVDVLEIDPPAGRLLTTHPVNSVAGARQIVAWYRMRWIIEQVFRALKSHGLRIEDSQMEDAGSFVKLAVVALIAAVRSMQLVLASPGSAAGPVIPRRATSRRGPRPCIAA